MKEVEEGDEGDEGEAGEVGSTLREFPNLGVRGAVACQQLRSVVSK
jgi:hypothetical protein